ncbi:MAG TPA: protein kinase [Bryobacteraceae bacterium]|nr:protein kinase [Bryobacteraceae bacterium]
MELHPSVRKSYLHEACADVTMRDEIESLIVSQDAPTGFVAHPDVNPDHDFPDDDAPTRDLLSGKRIGPYQLLHCLGTGGMGSVWLAERVDQEYERKVAIKMVRHGMDSRQILRRFRMERQVLAGLDHPNIAKLLDGGSTAEGLPYLVMEYVDGTPIDEYCDRRHSTVSERLELFRAACSAVEYAHRSLVVHRDIKSGNILVGSDGVPKLLDFGIAKLLAPEFAEHGLTQVDQRPMTIDYASPEQIRGQPITTATDVYSLGVLLYELLTGRLPHSGDNRSAAEVQWAICEEEPKRPSAVVMNQWTTAIPQSTQRLEAASPDSFESRDRVRMRLKRRLSGDLDMIVLKALRKEPERRYASVEQFSEDVRRHLENLPVLARGDAVRYRVGKFVRRHTAGVVAAGAIVVALIAGAIVSTYYARQATLQRARAERRFEEGRKLARFVLFDLDPALQSGVTPARRLVIGNALEYLNGLQREASNDLSLQREIMEAYLHVADVQSDPYHPNLGDPAGAASSLRQASAIAQAIYRDHPRDPEARRDLARVDVQLGDLVAFGGDRAAALKNYREALAHFEALASQNPRDLQRQQDVMDALRKIGFVQFASGDLTAAQASYRRYLNLAESFQHNESAGGKAPQAATLLAVASGYDHLGEILAKSGAREEGLASLRKALSIYQLIFDADRENPTARRSLVATGQVLGDALLAAGQTTEAIAEYRHALDLLEIQLKEDPMNMQSQRDMTVALGRLADALTSSGPNPAARPVTQRALALLKPLVRGPQASELDMQQYAWLLLTTPFQDLRDPREALTYAEKSVAITNGADPAMLDTLARAQAANRNFDDATRTEEKALALIPGGQSDLRKELEDNLARFKRSQTSAPNPKSASK